MTGVTVGVGVGVGEKAGVGVLEENTGVMDDIGVVNGMLVVKFWVTNTEAVNVEASEGCTMLVVTLGKPKDREETN